MKTYKTVQGDTWDLIAFKMYGNEVKMKELINANLPHINTSIFKANISINVPEITVGTNNSDLPPWMR